MKCGVGRVQCEVWSLKCEGRSGASNLTYETGRRFRRVYARTAHASSIDEKGLIKGNLGGETSVLRIFRMSGKVSQGKS